jgi:hypothetical protein
VIVVAVSLINGFTQAGTSISTNAGDGSVSRTPALKEIILSAVDPRDFMGPTVYDQWHPVISAFCAQKGMIVERLAR